MGLHKGSWEEELVGIEGTSIELRLAWCLVVHLPGRKSVLPDFSTMGITGGW